MSGKSKTFVVWTAAAAMAVGLLAMTGNAQAKGVTIGFAMPDLSESFWISVAYGVDSQAKKMGATVIKANAGGDNNVDQQISQIQDLIQRRVDALIVGATDGNAVRAVVNQAAAMGIPVVGISAIPNSDKLVSAVGADHYGMGKLQAQCLGNAIGGKGEVGALEFPAGQSWADERARGFKETITTEFPNIKLIAEDRIATVRNNSFETMQDWIQRFPGMDGVYTAYDDMGAGAVDAIKAAKKGGQIKVSSSNLSHVGEEMLRAGDIVCETTQQVVLQGEAAVKAAVTAANGGTPKKSVITTAIMVTKANIDSVDFSTIRAPAGYRP